MPRSIRTEVEELVIDIPTIVQHQVDNGEHLILGWFGLARGGTYLACINEARELARKQSERGKD